MVSNKILIGIVVVAIFLVGIFYFIFGNLNFNGGIISAHFELFPEGTEMGPGMVGIVTNVFSEGDIIGISGEADVNKEVELTFEIFDSDGNKVEGQEWRGEDIKINSGTFGFCCLNAPEKTGNYIFKIFLDNKESASLSFSVAD